MKLRITNPFRSYLVTLLAPIAALALCSSAQAVDYNFGTGTAPFTISATDQARVLGYNIAGAFNNDGTGDMSINWRDNTPNPSASDRVYTHFNLASLAGKTIVGTVNLNFTVSHAYGTNGNITNGQVSTPIAAWTFPGSATGLSPIAGSELNATIGNGSLATWTLSNTTFQSFVDNQASFYGLVISADDAASNAHFSGTPTLTGNIVDVASAAITVTGATDWSAATFDSGTSTLSVSGTSNVTSGNVSLTLGSTLSVTGSATLDSGAFAGSIAHNGTLLAFGSSANQTLSGVISGSGALTKSGLSTLTLTAANTYSGLTTVSEGTLRIGNGGTTGSLVSGLVTLASGATLEINRSDNYSTPPGQTFSGAGTLVKNGSGYLTFLPASNSFGNTSLLGDLENLVVSGGTVRSDSWAQWRSGLNLTVSGSGVFEMWATTTSIGNLSGNGTVQNSANFSGYSPGSSFATNNLSIVAGTFSGTIKDFGPGTGNTTSGDAGTADSRLNLTKTGPDTLTLSGTLAYSGNTAVEEGILSIGNGGTPTNLSDTATVSIGFGAKMDLNFTGSDTVGVLNIDASGPLPGGTYNSSHPIYGSYFTGAGSLVVPGSTIDYATWGLPYGLASGSGGLDLDNDGVINFEEYAFGLLPNSGASVNPIAVPLNKSTGTFSYTRLTNTGLTYSVWFSENLAGWTEDTGAVQGTPVPSGANETVPVTLSTLPGNPLPAKLFIRVRAN